MNVDELKQDLKMAGFSITPLNAWDNVPGQDYKSFTAKKCLWEWNGLNALVITLAIYGDIDNDGRFQSLFVTFRPGEKSFLIPLSADRREAEDWRPMAKQLVKNFLAELEKVSIRLAEFDMTGV